MRDDGSRIVQIYYGDGKGKTSSAVGQAVRAAGNGFTVFFIQFLKRSENSGETAILGKVPGIVCKSYGTGRFLSPETVTDEDHLLINGGFSWIYQMVGKHKPDMLVLDEVGDVITLGLVSEDVIIEIVDSGAGWLDTVMTGHEFSAAILERADLVTRLEKVKHHYDLGIPSRRGIEF